MSNEVNNIKIAGICPECRKGRLVLIEEEDYLNIHKIHTYKCDFCGYKFRMRK